MASAVSAEFNVGDEMDKAPAFSKATLFIFLACFGGGLVFGYGVSTSMFQNEINTARTEDAKALRASFGEKITAFNEALPKIMAMSDTTVDFEGAAALAKLEFAASGNQLSNNRLLIGQVAIDNVTSYTTDSQMLAGMIAEHNRLTNTVDKEELEQLMADSKVADNDFFGVVFDYKHALKSGGEEGYLPKEGQVVIGRGPAEDQPGKFKVEYPATGSEAIIDMIAYIPIGKNQIIKSGGQTALTRYQWRVRQIKFQADKISKYTESVLTSLDAVAAE